MFYIYTIGVPLLILFIVYIISNPKPTTFRGIIKLIAKSLPYQFGYTFLMYFLEIDNITGPGAGWIFYTLIFFLLPISFIVLFLLLIYRYKDKTNKTVN